MADSIAVKILQNIRTTLATIDGVTVKGHEQHGTAQNDMNIVVEMAECIEDPEGYPCPLLRDSHLQSFDIVACATQAPSDAAEIDERLVNLEAEITKKLKADYTRGGYAQNQYFPQGKDDSGKTEVGGLPARLVRVKVLFWTAASDGFTAA